MGNQSSIDALARMNQYTLDKNAATKKCEDVKKKLRGAENISKKTSEQMDIIRFKTEVITNMLSIEESKKVNYEKRIEALKFSLAKANESKINDNNNNSGISSSSSSGSKPVGIKKNSNGSVSEEEGKEEGR